MTDGWYVDDRCLICNLSRQYARGLIAYAEGGSYGGLSTVVRQPETDEEVRRMYEAAHACPTRSVHPPADDWAEGSDPYPYPLPLDDEGVVLLCGHASQRTYGAASYLLRRPDGTAMVIDTPRWQPALARRYEQRVGTIADVLLTHLDHVAHGRKYADALGARLWIHEGDLHSRPDADSVIRGRDPVEIGPGVIAYPFPATLRVARCSSRTTSSVSPGTRCSGRIPRRISISPTVWSATRSPRGPRPSKKPPLAGGRDAGPDAGTRAASGGFRRAGGRLRQGPLLTGMTEFTVPPAPRRRCEQDEGKAQQERTRSMTAIAGEQVDITTGDGVADAYCVRPDDGVPHPGVLFYTDAFGLRSNVRTMADRLAGAGYVVLVPNLFYRSGRAPVLDLPEFIDLAARPQIFERIMPLLAQATAPADALHDAGHFLGWLREHSAGGPVGVTGYCMGAGLSLRAAANYPAQVAAAAGFHGGNLATEAADSPHLLADRVEAELYFGHADNDRSLPPEQVERLAAALRDAGVRHVAEVYEGAPHGYTQADTSSYDSDAAERHWTALLDLLARNLKS